jgi:hypothetical protein
MRNFLDKSCREKQNSHFMFNNFNNRPVYEIMWKSMVELGRPQMAWRLRIACWLPKATKTHSEYVHSLACQFLM